MTCRMHAAGSWDTEIQAVHAVNGAGNCAAAAPGSAGAPTAVRVATPCFTCSSSSTADESLRMLHEDDDLDRPHDHILVSILCSPTTG